MIAQRSSPGLRKNNKTMTQPKLPELDAKERLELFIEQAEAWTQYVKAIHPDISKAGIYRNSNDDEWQIHPTIYGSVCILRMFMQSRDGIALYLLERDTQTERAIQRQQTLLKNLPGLSEEWNIKVEQAYTWIDQALTIPQPKLVYKDEILTRWKILETFLYGKYGHVIQEHRETYKQWQAIPDLFKDIQLEFVSTVWFIHGQIRDVAEASKKELSLLATNTNIASSI